MDTAQFDALVRSFADAASRRRLLRLVVSLTLGGAVTGLVGDAGQAERPHDRLHRRTRQRNRKQRNKRRKNSNQGGPGTNNNGNSINDGGGGGGRLGNPGPCGPGGSACNKDGDCCSGGCCGGTCCFAPANQCNLAGLCCAPNCAGKQCGPDGCGARGTCGTCTGGATCDVATGQCQGGSTCGPQSCSTGCCDSTGVCQLGTTNQACGTDGATCASCSGQQTCQNKQCQSSSTCTSGSCPEGCCAGTTCAGGGTWEQCGQDGKTCLTCLTGQVCAGGSCGSCATQQPADSFCDAVANIDRYKCGLVGSEGDCVCLGRASGAPTPFCASSGQCADPGDPPDLCHRPGLREQGLRGGRLHHDGLLRTKLPRQRPLHAPVRIADGIGGASKSPRMFPLAGEYPNTPRSGFAAPQTVPAASVGRTGVGQEEPVAPVPAPRPCAGTLRGRDGLGRAAAPRGAATADRPWRARPWERSAAARCPEGERCWLAVERRPRPETAG